MIVINLRMFRSKPVLVILGIILIIGFIFVKEKIDTEHLKKVCTQSASGTVMEIKKEKRNSDEKVLVISYLTSGTKYTAEITDNKKVGDKVSIYFNPNDPTQVISKAKKDTASGIGMYLLIGIPLLLYLGLQRVSNGSGGGSGDKLKDAYKKRMEELKADDDFDYGE